MIWEDHYFFSAVSFCTFVHWLRPVNTAWSWASEIKEKKSYSVRLSSRTWSFLVIPDLVLACHPGLGPGSLSPHLRDPPAKPGDDKQKKSPYKPGDDKQKKSRTSRGMTNERNPRTSRGMTNKNNQPLCADPISLISFPLLCPLPIHQSAYPGNASFG